MNKKEFGLMIISVFIWGALGVPITNWLFPRYSCAPITNYHVYFFLFWIWLPILYFIRIIHYSEDQTE